MHSGQFIAAISEANRKQQELAKDSDLLIQNAELAAKNAIPHVYDLTEPNPENTPLSFYVFGCAGNASDAQKEVAALMNSIASNPKNKPKFILVLGDNFYDWGVNSPLDPMFQSNFDNIYADRTLKSICGIPCYLVLGNHCENIHRMRLPLQEKGVERGMHQVAHSYLPEENSAYDSTEKKIALYSSDKVDVNQLPKWNMPNRYYSLIDGNTQIFCIDSNTYVGDYLAYVNGANTDRGANQAAWLEDEVNKAKKAGKRVLLVGHHPLYTPGSRAYESDTDLYLSQDQLAQAKTLFKEIKNNDPYNTYLRNCLKQQHLEFDAVIAAHDHNISYYNNNNIPNCDYPICQITSGGGGGKTQKRKKFSNQDQMGCFLKEHGFVMMTCNNSDAKKMMFTIHAANGKYQHVYSNEDCLPKYIFPKKMPQEEIDKIKLFFTTIRQSIGEYFSFIGDLQDQNHGKFFKKNVSHGYDGIQRVHDLWAYINNVAISNFHTILEDVHSIAKWRGIISAPSEHSFITIFNAQLKKSFHRDLDTLVRIESTMKKTGMLMHQK